MLLCPSQRDTSVIGMPSARATEAYKWRSELAVRNDDRFYRDQVF
jgi:hypothetical protein